MRILAVDPGPVESAFVIWDTDGPFVRHHDKVDNETMRKMLISNSADVVAIEQVASYGMAVGAEVFATCEWSGRFVECSIPTPLMRLFRKDVKMHLCHNMRARDSNIRQALIDLLGSPGTKKNPGPTYGIAGDEWAALAVAITCEARLKGQIK